MRATILFVALVGCGTPAPVASETPSLPTHAPPSSVAAVPPDDFTMEAGGGEMLRRPPAPGEMVIVTRLEPRPSTSGQFDLVERSEPTPPSEAPSVEMRRVQIPAARVAALYAILASGRSVLERPCVNMDVQDGESHFVRVHERGVDTEYRCTNTTTPELDALQGSFTALVTELMPPLAES